MRPLYLQRGVGSGHWAPARGLGEGDALGQGHWLLLVPPQHNTLY